jgi:hypothetical protein
MKFLPPFQVNSNLAAMLWAVASQSIWLPVFLLGAQEQRSGNPKDSNSNLVDQGSQDTRQPFVSGSFRNHLPSQNISSSTQGGRSSGNANILLNATFNHGQSSLGDTARSLTDKSSLNSTYEIPKSKNFYSSESPVSGMNDRKTQPSEFLDSGSNRLSSATFIQRLYSRSDLLGGTVTLQDLSEPIMPPIARAERAQWSRSGDPLAPLPQIWREPMRRALTALSQESLTANASDSKDPKGYLNLDEARFVHIPSSRIRQSSEIPLALQADGSVDILNKPDDPVIIDEIKRWSSKQRLPVKGKISPAVVHLHPMEPLKIGSSQKEQPAFSRTTSGRFDEAAVPPMPVRESKPIAVPATTSGGDAPSGSNSTPSISTTPPEPVSSTQPVPPSEAES